MKFNRRKDISRIFLDRIVAISFLVALIYHRTLRLGEHSILVLWISQINQPARASLPLNTERNITQLTRMCFNEWCWTDVKEKSLKFPCLHDEQETKTSFFDWAETFQMKKNFSLSKSAMYFPCIFKWIQIQLQLPQIERSRKKNSFPPAQFLICYVRIQVKWIVIEEIKRKYRNNGRMWKKEKLDNLKTFLMFFTSHMLESCVRLWRYKKNC